MAGKKSAATPGEDLQRRVERFLAGTAPVPEKMSLEEVRSLVHELHVHQLELEAQNAAWRRRQEQLEASHRNLAAWYDFIPVGCFTFDRDGLIVDVNLTGTGALGVAKEFLLNRPFCGFVEPELQGTFQVHLQRGVLGRRQASVPAATRAPGGRPFPGLSAKPGRPGPPGELFPLPHGGQRHQRAGGGRGTPLRATPVPAKNDRYGAVPDIL